MGKPGSESVFSRMFSSSSASGPKKDAGSLASLSDSSDVFIRVGLELLQNTPFSKRNDNLKNAIKSSYSKRCIMYAKYIAR